MIITVRRSAPHFLVDSLLTAAGWLLFLYLLLDATAAWWTVWGQEAAPDAAAPAIHPAIALLDTLAYPLGVLCILLLTGSWHIHRRQLEGGAGEQPPLPNPLNDEVLAGHFLISQQDLGRVHDSRRTVIHLTEDGAINRMEVAGERQASGAPGQESQHIWSNGHRQYSVMHPSADAFEKPTEFANPLPGRTAHARPEPHA